MFRIEILVETEQEAEEIKEVLEVSEEDGILDFPFSLRLIKE